MAWVWMIISFMIVGALALFLYLIAKKLFKALRNALRTFGRELAKGAKDEIVEELDRHDSERLNQLANSRRFISR